MTVVGLEALMGLLGEGRVRRGLSLEEVACRAGWANESIPRRLERPGGNPTLKSVQRYAEALPTAELTLTANDLAEIERAVPASAVAGERYAPAQLAQLDSER